LIPPLVVREQVSAVILAGGRSRRMEGRDKAFVKLHGRPLIRWVIARLRTQVNELFIAANPNNALYRSLGFELLADPFGPDNGPLAGILAGLQRADTPYLLTAPCDVPYLPDTLVERLLETMETTNARAVTASDGTRQHGTISLIDRDLAADLRDYLQSGNRQVRGWLASVDAQVEDFSLKADAFMNINSGHDLVLAEAMPPPWDR